jgi:transposase-like protein
MRRRLVADALVYTGGNRAAASRLLDVSTLTLRAWVQEFDLDPEVLGQYRRRELAAQELGVEVTGARWTWLCPEGHEGWSTPKNLDDIGPEEPRGTWAAIRDAHRHRVASEALAQHGDPALAGIALGINPATVRRWGRGHKRNRAGRGTP